MFKGKSKRQKAASRSVVHLFHGVEVLPGSVACADVMALEGKRLLSEDAPMLPLGSCTQFTRCSCRYRHFKDRRTQTRRETDDGLPPRHVESERRSQTGRRVTDR